MGIVCQSATKTVYVMASLKFARASQLSQLVRRPLQKSTPLLLSLGRLDEGITDFALSMPDAFFVSNKSRKRKRNDHGEPSSSTKVQRTSKPPSKRGPPGNPSSSNQRGGKPNGFKSKVKGKGKQRDEDGGSDVTSEDDELGGDIDDLDLRASDIDPNASGSDEEDELETAAEKRLRLAKLYLQSVKDGIAAGVL